MTKEGKDAVDILHLLELLVMGGWYYSLLPLLKRNVSDGSAAFGTTL